MGADHAIAEVCKRLDCTLQNGSIAPDVLMLAARAFAPAFDAQHPEVQQ